MIQIIITFLVTSYPILNRYASPIEQITLVEFGIIVSFICYLFTLKKHNYKIKIFISAMAIVLYLFAYVLLLFMPSRNNTDAIGTTLRLMFIYFQIAVIFSNTFSIVLARKMVRIWAIILSVYGLLQVFLVKFGIILSSNLPFLPLLPGTIDIDKVMFEQVHVYDMTFRCRSFMTEPAMLCTYLALAVFLELFINQYDAKYKHSLLAACLYSLVCFVSMSSTGIGIVIFIWSSYFYLQLKSSSKKVLFKRVFLFSAMIFVGLIISVETGILDYFLRHTFGESLQISEILNSSRFYALDLLQETFDSPTTFLFGHSLEQTREYLPGFARVYYTLGFIGEMLFLAFFYSMLKKTSRKYRGLFWVYVILNIGTEILLGSFSVIYTAFLINSKNEGDNT